MNGRTISSVLTVLPAEITRREFLQRCFSVDHKAATPAIFKNYLPKETCWQYEPERLVTIASQPQNISHLNVLIPPGNNAMSQHTCKRKRMRLDDVLKDALFETSREKTAQGKGFGGLQARAALEPLLQDLPHLFAGGDGLRLIEPESAVWITSPGLRTALHSDPFHGLLLHLYGLKRFVIISPQDSDCDMIRLQEILRLRRSAGSIPELYGWGEETPQPHPPATAVCRQVNQAARTAACGQVDQAARIAACSQVNQVAPTAVCSQQENRAVGTAVCSREDQAARTAAGGQVDQAAREPITGRHPPPQASRSCETREAASKAGRRPACLDGIPLHVGTLEPERWMLKQY